MAWWLQRLSAALELCNFLPGSFVWPLPGGEASSALSQRAGALVLTQCAEPQPGPGPAGPLAGACCLPFRWEMEDLVHGHTAPQGQSLKSALLAAGPVSSALLGTSVIHRLLAGNAPRPEGLRRCGESIVLGKWLHPSPFPCTHLPSGPVLTLSRGVP